MHFDQLIVLVSGFVDQLFKKKLSPCLYFHNLTHTLYVVKAVQEIGYHVQLTQKQQETVTLAAWFHDTGYTEAYKNHELVSVEIATEFLISVGVVGDQLADIRACILATQYPQHPSNLMEMVICDADFYHFAIDDYTQFAAALKKEWEAELGHCYTTQQWNNINLEMLRNHQYFTAYGQEILQKSKEHNIGKLKAFF
ncbi:HD domain-containing protein [Pedobacter sp. Hv1]|uniref:HD domain-containing protein n=1 Tax=Pedobacter sp. Hv1 TaxID=1740090 RepID=UPI0006D897D7|nr:HD domain-containing protein [Pedobacter sp. Hv1]KQC00029.1 hypothetical protein AQF98_16105 [Pedobacter sp. Hv1]